MAKKTTNGTNGERVPVGGVLLASGDIEINRSAPTTISTKSTDTSPSSAKRPLATI